MSTLGSKTVFSSKKGRVVKTVSGDLSYGFRAYKSNGNTLGKYPTLAQAKRVVSTGREQKVAFSENFRTMSKAEYKRFKK